MQRAGETFCLPGVYFIIQYCFVFITCHSYEHISRPSPLFRLCVCLSACLAICDGACKVRSLVLYEFFRVFYALSTKICSPRVFTTTTTAIATHQQQPQQQHQETAANFIYHVPLRLQVCCLCCSARLVQLLSSFSAEQQIFFQRSNLVSGKHTGKLHKPTNYPSTRTFLCLFICRYSYIF